jgi:hypothetical protein
MLTRDSREGSHTKSIHVQMGWISSQVQQSTRSREEGAAAVGGGSGREREGACAARGVGLIDACAGWEGERLAPGRMRRRNRGGFDYLAAARGGERSLCLAPAVVASRRRNCGLRQSQADDGEKEDCGR